MIEAECYVFRGPHKSFGAHVLINGKSINATAVSLKRTSTVEIKSGDLLKISRIGDIQTMLCLVYKQHDGLLYIKPINIDELGLDIVMAVMDEMSIKTMTEKEIDHILSVWRTL